MFNLLISSGMFAFRGEDRAQISDKFINRT